MSRLQQATSTKRQSSTIREILIGIVTDVIVDDTHEFVTDIPFEDIGESFGKTIENIGSAKIRPAGDSVSSDDELRFIPPFDYTNLELPIIGETVELVNLPNGTTTYRRMANHKLNIGNAILEVDSALNPYKDTNKEQDYSTTSQTGTPTAEASESEIVENKYFEETKINPLKFYEGDKVIQSRFGQSIRFSGYNNIDNVLAPTIIIRNRQGDKSLDELKISEPTFEDIIDDGSVIVLASGDHLLEFTPGTVDTPLETEPIYAEEPELKGTDQVLINSGRIILSSKDSEMLFYSKGNYSFISDGKLTIDNGLDGADMDFNGDVLITTNDNDFTILGGTGEIFLNTESTDEPLVRGETLLDLMEQLIDAINAQIFSTPAGPTMMGPNNRGDFNTIKSKLNTFLSTLNYTE
jgi:hypothetical protein|tara:strand:+ start:996 stop:2222 length:1227 start_codon:yes stop_codon:yes gene_type:complete